MTMVPDAPKKTALQKADLKPDDVTYKPGRWTTCINFLRIHVGMLPLDLSKRWAEAKVCQEEEKAYEKHIENEVKLIKARQEFEQVRLELRKQRTEIRSIAAEARSKEEDARIKRLVRIQLEASGQTSEEAVEHLKSVMKQIEFAGGHVDLELPEPPEEE
jgi:hypothetical protein